MDFGFVTRCLSDLETAKRLGFDGVEFLAHPGWELNPVTATTKDADQIGRRFKDAGIKLMAVAHYDSRMAEGTPEAMAGLENTVRLLPALGTKLLTINAWVPPSATDDEQLAFLVGYMKPILKIAEDTGVAIAIENCPHEEANFARSPYNWARMFEALPSPAFGMEYDPSHLIWQGADYVQALRDVASRVIAFHAKDTEIRYEILRSHGMIRSDWWRFRVPGLGDANWRALFRILIDIKYNGPVIIEHENPVLEGDRREEGLTFGLNHLKAVLTGGI